MLSCEGFSGRNVPLYYRRKNILYIKQAEPGLYQIRRTKAQWRDFWRSYFHLDRSYRQIRRQIPDTDSYMKKAASCGSGLRILRQEPWEMLITFIISQQRTIPSIKGAVEGIAEIYGDAVETDYETVHLFPTPAQMCRVTPEDLKQFRLDTAILIFWTPLIRCMGDSLICTGLRLMTIRSCSML